MADIKYAVYKIFNGDDFDTIYFKAPAAAITTDADRQFITAANKALITEYLVNFNAANKLVKLNGSGKIPSNLIDEDFGNYLDKRLASGTQAVNSLVEFNYDRGIFTPNGINLNLESATDTNINRLSAVNGEIKLSVGTDSSNQEITFKKDGNLEFKKSTEIKNVKLGADSSAVPKSYVDTVIESGAKPKEAVVAATAVSYGTIPSGESPTPDGVSVVAGDRVLLKDQLNKSENGIYVVSTGTWSRVASESDLKGTLVFVEKGNENNDSKWFHEGGGEWIKFSQTDQLQFSGGLTRSSDNVSLANNAIVDAHIKSDAAIALTKLGAHTGTITNWDANATAAIITQATPIDKRLTDLAMTIYRLRGDVGTTQNYGEWSSESLSISKVNDIAVAKQNPVRWGNAAPSTTGYNDGDVYLHTDN